MSMEREYLLEKFSLKLQRSASKYPFLADEKNREAVLQLLAETLMEDTEILNKLDSVGYDKVKDMMNSLLEGALRRIEENLKKEIRESREDLTEGIKTVIENQLNIGNAMNGNARNILDSIALSHQKLRDAIREVKIAVEKEGQETREQISNISWLRDRSF